MGERTCSAEDCNNPYVARGLCNKHYLRAKQAGTLQSIPRPSVLERLKSKIQEQSNGCWEWQGRVQPNGYGQMWSGKKVSYAHRISYEVHIGAIPEGLVIDHICRNRRCVNPLHLEAVTIGENSARGLAPGFIAKRLGICKRGHARTPGQQCKICHSMLSRKRYLARRDGLVVYELGAAKTLAQTSARG